jgi:hypothetical protein
MFSAAWLLLGIAYVIIQGINAKSTRDAAKAAQDVWKATSKMVNLQAEVMMKELDRI